MGAVYLVTTIPDIKPDKKAGITTTGVKLGMERTLSLAILFVVFSLIASLMINDLFAFALILISRYFFLFAKKHPNENNIRRVFIMSAALFTFAMGIVFWYYMAFVIILVFFLHYYYRKNFNKSYP
jgi:4-hydroxybenzoate polyprenyltransferase